MLKMFEVTGGFRTDGWASLYAVLAESEEEAEQIMRDIIQDKRGPKAEDNKLSLNVGEGVEVKKGAFIEIIL